mgnify:CR=1 FL=1
MRKIFIAAVAIIFLLNLSVYLAAESAPATNFDSNPGEYESTGKIDLSPWDFDVFKVGYVKNTNFIFEDRPRHKIGYGYDYMRFLEMYANCKFEFVEYETWDLLVAAFENKEIDMMPGMPGDWRKIPNALRTAHVIGRFPMELVVKDKKIKPNMKIGTLTSSYPAPAFPSIAKSEGMDYQEVSFSNYEQMIEAYKTGEIDGYVSALLKPRGVSDVIALFDRQSYRLIIHSDNKTLFDRMDLAMDQMLLVQTNLRDKLNQRYMLQSELPLVLSKEERDYLAARKKLKAAMFLHYQPFSYHDEQGNLTGLFPELIHKIADDLGIEIEIIETHSIKETQDLIQSGGVDIVADTILDHSWGSDSNINLTQSYLTYEYAAATRTGYKLNPDDNPIVAYVPNMILSPNILTNEIPADRLLKCRSWEECLQAVSDGRADVTYILKSAIQPLCNETGNYGIEISSTTYFTEPCALGVYAYENPQLWHILNVEINHVSSAWIQNVLNKHRVATAALTPMYLIYHHPMRVIIFITLLAIGIGWLIIYKNRMQQRHFELVQHMAYTDLRYNLPNVPWLEKEVPNLFAKVKDSEPNMQTFFVIFSMDSGVTVAEESGRKIIDKTFKGMAADVATDKPVICVAAGIDVENLICFCKAENLETISNWAEMVVNAYSYAYTVDAQARVVLHTKAGISSYTPAIYVQQAIDRAITACRHKSNDSVVVFDEKLEEQMTTQHVIESKMQQALYDDEFKAYYQPKYDLKTRKIVGAEALVRWISPETGFMPPGKFIPLFEENGFVIQVDYYILEKTFQLQKDRLESGKEVIPISVNQSRLHMTEEGYLEKMKAIVEKYNIPAGLIELEVTETMFGDFDNKASQQNAIKVVQGLHELGFPLSVDDFGSGYSSFGLLGILPMEVMKIDRSVLTGADTSERMKEILAYVIKLGHALDMEVLCEGIETREQEILLLGLGCRLGQGFFNAKPMPVDEFEKFFEQRNAEVVAGTVSIPE